MRKITLYVTLALFSLLPFQVYSKVYLTSLENNVGMNTNYYHSYTFQSISKKISKPSQKRIVVDPRTHTWKAYSSDGKLLRSGLATAGGKWCSDIGRSCRTKSGVFRIYSLGSASCKSKKYPVGRGGAPMPYCMYFNGGQGLHGSYQVVAGNVSHGCVRLHVKDARWIRFNFATIGTKVIIKSY